jgi:hypothetical protein
MKYIIIILMILSLTSCISNNAGNTKAIMSIPNMVNGDLPDTLISIPQIKNNKKVVYENSENSSYNYDDVYEKDLNVTEE